MGINMHKTGHDSGEINSLALNKKEKDSVGKNSPGKASTDSWKHSRPSFDRTHHVLPEGAMYDSRFDEVLAFHSPGLAPVRKGEKWFYIKPDSNPAFGKEYTRAFGFYENKATVREGDDWYHIDEKGNPVYTRRFAWCGNFQNGRCMVREKDLCYHHITPEGEEAYPERYLYAGDFREGAAVVRLDSGLCTHIDENGKQIHGIFYPELDVYHKGFARACDEKGWFHVDISGRPVYKKRFQSIEPFYNGQALCRDLEGRLVIIAEDGAEILEISPTPSLRETIGPKILVIGTLGAGKTTICSLVSEKMNLPFVSIDGLRQQHGDDTFTGEYRAWTRFMEMCEKPEASVLEFSGGGPHTFAVRQALLKSGMPVHVIWLDVPPEIGASRFSKDLEEVPTPLPWGDVRLSASSIYREIEKAWDWLWAAKPAIKALRLKAGNEKTIEEIYSELMRFLEGKTGC